MPEGDVSAYAASNVNTPRQPTVERSEPVRQPEEQVQTPEEVTNVPSEVAVAPSVAVNISTQGQAVSAQAQTQANRTEATEATTQNAPANAPVNTQQPQGVQASEDNNPVNTLPEALEVSDETREQIADDTQQAIDAQANTDGSATLDILS